ncbi:MAG: hypothetical protein RSD57_17045 [Comamonas sp.]
MTAMILPRVGVPIDPDQHQALRDNMSSTMPLTAPTYAPENELTDVN